MAQCSDIGSPVVACLSCLAMFLLVCTSLVALCSLQIWQIAAAERPLVLAPRQVGLLEIIDMFLDNAGNVPFCKCSLKPVLASSGLLS